MERLQKIIALSGYASRRKAEELIKAGKVMVNGKVVRELGTKANFSDDILIDGKKIEREVFGFRENAAKVIKQPTEEEMNSAINALEGCPTGAIEKEEK